MSTNGIRATLVAMVVGAALWWVAFAAVRYFLN